MGNNRISMPMTTNLARLQSEIDAADAELIERTKEEKALAEKLQQATHARQLAAVKAAALLRAMVGEAPVATHVEPEKTSAFAQCVEAIRTTFIMPLREGVTDRMAQEQLEKAGHKFRLPTVRNALAEIGNSSRASHSPGTAAIGVKPKTACAMLDCGTTRLYQLLKEKQLVWYKDGRSTKILVSSIEAFVRRKIDQQTAA